MPKKQPIDLKVPTAFSATSVKTFLHCQMLFYMVYLLGLHLKLKLPRKIFFARGSSLHWVFEKFFKLKNGYKSAKSMGGAFVNRLMGEIEGRYGRGNRPCRVDTKSDDFWKMVGFYRKLARAFFDFNQPYRLEPGLIPQVEVRFHINHSGYKLHGSLDRLQPTQNGQFEIWDYKTGRVSSSRASTYWDVQWIIYSLAGLKLTDSIPPIKVMAFKKVPIVLPDVDLAVDMLNEEKQAEVEEYCEKLEDLANGISHDLEVELIDIPEPEESQYHWLTTVLNQIGAFICFYTNPQNEEAWKMAQKFGLIISDLEVAQGYPLFRAGSHCEYCDFDEICLNPDFQTIIENARRDLLARNLEALGYFRPASQQGLPL